MNSVKELLEELAGRLPRGWKIEVTSGGDVRVLDKGGICILGGSIEWVVGEEIAGEDYLDRRFREEKEMDVAVRERYAKLAREAP